MGPIDATCGRIVADLKVGRLAPTHLWCSGAPRSIGNNYYAPWGAPGILGSKEHKGLTTLIWWIGGSKEHRD